MASSVSMPPRSNITMALAGTRPTATTVPTSKSSSGPAQVEDIKPRGIDWSSKASFAAIAAAAAARPDPAVVKNDPHTRARAGLPTPPNSISPTLPPRGFREHQHRPAPVNVKRVSSGHSPSAPPTPPAQAVASDMELPDPQVNGQATAAASAAQNDAKVEVDAGDRQDNIAAADAAGSITPALLAIHHLPDILLTHGPLAIRHIIGHLAAVVPGFAGIPPAKSRRLVVSALEGRSVGAAQSSDSNDQAGTSSGRITGGRGGVDNDIVFEKVGWGRWDARPRTFAHASNPSARRHVSPVLARQPRLASSATSASLRSPSPYARPQGIPLRPRLPSRQELARSHDTPPSALSKPYLRTRPAASSRGALDRRPLDDADDLADRMMLDLSDIEGADVDDDAILSASEPGDPGDFDPDEGDATDEEDWAGIGAAALRAGSFPRLLQGASSLPSQQRSISGKPIDYNARARRDSSTPRHGGMRQSSGMAIPRTSGGAPSSALAKSAPMLDEASMRELMKGVADAEDGEAAAAQALLQLGSA